MTNEPDADQITQLIEAVQKLSVTSEQVAVSLTKLETLFIDMLRKQDEDRTENKDRMKKSDEEHEEFKRRQKKWDEQTESLNSIKNPWVAPAELANLLLMAAFLVIASATAILASR